MVFPASLRVPLHGAEGEADLVLTFTQMAIGIWGSASHLRIQETHLRSFTTPRGSDVVAMRPMCLIPSHHSLHPPSSPWGDKDKLAVEYAQRPVVATVHPAPHGEAKTLEQLRLGIRGCRRQHPGSFLLPGSYHLGVLSFHYRNCHHSGDLWSSLGLSVKIRLRTISRKSEKWVEKNIAL